MIMYVVRPLAALASLRTLRPAYGRPQRAQYFKMYVTMDKGLIHLYVTMTIFFLDALSTYSLERSTFAHAQCELSW